MKASLPLSSSKVSYVFCHSLVDSTEFLYQIYIHSMESVSSTESPT